VICITTKKPPIKPAKKKRWLSPTSISTYLWCPRKWYLRYVIKLKTTPNIYILRGNVIHKCLERFLKEGYSDYAHYDDLRGAILSLLRDEWESRDEKFNNLNLNSDEIRFFYYESQKMIINFLHNFLKSGEVPGHPSDLELKIFSRKYRTMCIVDKVLRNHDPPLIVDYKTCKSAELKDEYKRQMGICTLLFEDKYGIKPKAAIHYLKFHNGLKEVPLTKKYMESLKRLIVEVHDKTQSENEADYPCTCGGWCEKDVQVPAKT